MDEQVCDEVGAAVSYAVDVSMRAAVNVPVTDAVYVAVDVDVYDAVAVAACAALRHAMHDDLRVSGGDE